jgi:hypothetical protein
MMTYDYQTERPKLFTKNGLLLYTAIRDQARRFLDICGAADLDHLIHLPETIGAADTYQMTACVDFLCEMGDLKEVQHPDPISPQDRVFIAGRNLDRRVTR